MTSADTYALIEEARRHPDECADAFEQGHWDADQCVYYTPDECDGCDAAKLIGRLAAVLETSEAARKDLTDKIEALVKRWTAMASVHHEPLSDYDHGSSVGLDVALEDCARELRGLISRASKERSDG